ncbi:hypothetical protein [Nitrosopumilus cobalaminigenes]|nr:hypothetical protein [Nitrosopumilus cobalaminigenes]
MSYVYADNDIPFWIQNNAHWWSLDKINDDEFAHGVDWLLFDTLLESSSVSSKNNIPHWFKNVASYWTNDLISNVEFIDGLQYLLDQNIISIQRSISISDYKEHRFSGTNEIFKIYAYEKDFYFDNDVPIPKDIQFELKSDYFDLEEITYDSTKQNVVVIIPIFTSSAYWEPGFYNFFRGECGIECLTTNIEFSKFFGFNASDNAVKILSLLGYPFVYDIDVDQNPEILSEFDSVIVLHNEYVTQNEFDAITTHPHVLHLYPNSLYGHISVNYSDDTISLISGHGYPDENIQNGFNWKNENTHPYEFDIECLNWEFYSISNGKMLNCYPEHLIIDDSELLKEIKSLTINK